MRISDTGRPSGLMLAAVRLNDGTASIDAVGTDAAETAEAEKTAAEAEAE